MKKNNGGFTLIEVMIVIIILAALASMVAPHLMDIPDRMKDKIVIGDMEQLDTVLKVYRLEKGAYPGSLGDLMAAPSGSRNRTTPYLEKEPRDPWGEWYEYRHPGTKSRVGYDLYSKGKNMKDDSGDGDDIPNWQREE